MNADDDTNEPTPDLSETLGEIAEQAKPVDLSQAVARKVRSLRRRRNAAGGVAAVVAVVVVAGGGYALTRTTGASSVNGSAAAAAPSSGFGWFAYAPLPDGTPIAVTTPSNARLVTPAAPSSGIVTAAPGTTTLPPPPSLTVTPLLTPTVSPPYTSTAPAPLTTTPTHPSSSPTVSTTPPASTNAAPLPCTVADDFASGAAGTLVVTDAMKAKARAMGDKLCELVGGGARYNIEEWISIGGVSGGFNGLTYDVQAHLTGAGAGPVNNEAWVAVYQAPAGSKPTFKDGTTIALQTDLAVTLKGKIEVEGGPFDAFAGG